MAYEADKVVVELIAKNDQFDAAVKSSASSFEQSTASIVGSAAQAEKGSARFSSALKENRLQLNQTRLGMMEFQHIARGTADQIAAGAPLTQILTQHLGMLSEAVALSGGAFGKLGSFLGGPWGIALTLATVLGAKFVQHFFDEKEGLDQVYDKLLKHKEQTALNAQAEDIWAHSIDGLIERSEKLNDKLEKRLQTQTDLQKQTLSQAQGDFAAATSAAARLETDPNATKKQIADAQKAIHDTAIALHNAQVLAAQDAGEAIASISQAAKTWADEQLHAIQVIQGYHPELAEKGAADQMLAAYNELKDAIDKAAAANLDFNGTVVQTNRLNTELASGAIGVKTYDQSIRNLAKSLRDAAAAGKNAVETFKQSVIGAEGTGANKLGSHAAGFGQFMPSTFESYFKQLYPQQAAGMSNPQIDALRNNREIATAVIDAATKDYVTVLQRAGQQITAASLYTVHLLGAGDAHKLLAAAPGAQTSSFLSAGVLRGNPFLQGTAADARAAIAKRIGDSSSAVSSGAAAIAQMQEQQARKELEQAAAFTNEMDRLNVDLLKAREEQVKDSLTQLDFQEDEVRAEQQKRDDSYRSSVTTEKLTQAQADQLIAASASVAAEKLKALGIEKQAEIISRQDAAAEREAQYRQDYLKSAEAAATSQGQRREIDLAILDILYDEKLAHLERLKLIAEGNGEIQKANDLQAQIEHLPSEKAAARQDTLRGTMDPLEAWLHSVPHDAQAVTDALQGIAVNGFDNIANSIAGVITGTQSLGDAFKNLAKEIVSDLIQMTVRMLIFRALSSLIGLGGGIPSPDIGALANVDLGNIAPLPSLPGGFRASGGPVSRGGSYIVGEHGPELFVPGSSGSIVPNNSRAASPWAGGGGGVVVMRVEASPYFDTHVLDVTGPVIVQASTNAAHVGSALARENLARKGLHRLG